MIGCVSSRDVTIGVPVLYSSSEMQKQVQVGALFFKHIYIAYNFPFSFRKGGVFI